MKIIKKILGFLSLVLMLGGLIVLGWEYFRNKTTFAILRNNSVVKGTIPVLKNMGLSLLAFILGLLFLSLYFKAGGVVRRVERERKEAMKAQVKESEELNRQLRLEAENAKAEAEQAKKETELMKLSFMRKREEEPAEAPAETENEEQA